MDVKMYTTAEFAAKANLCDEHVRRLIRQGKINAVYSGSKKKGYLIPEIEIYKINKYVNKSYGMRDFITDRINELDAEIGECIAERDKLLRLLDLIQSEEL